MGYDGVFRVSFPICEYEEKGGLCVGIGLSYLIEISQLYHAPWIDAIRATALGGLVLGFGFLWSDILCYTVGVLLGIIVDGLLGWSRK